MAKIPFTLRELKKAHRALHEASNKQPRDNAHRLLLFYAIECGLKAAWIKRESRTLYDGKDAHGKLIGGGNGHDLVKIVDGLRLGVKMSSSFDLTDCYDQRRNRVERRDKPVEALHQAWRYGGTLVLPPVNDADIEEQLEALHRVIEKELKS